MTAPVPDKEAPTVRRCPTCHTPWRSLTPVPDPALVTVPEKLLDRSNHSDYHWNCRACDEIEGIRLAALVARSAPPVDEEQRIEAVCEVMHDAYEAAAAQTGWETQERSRKPWADVPEANKATMRIAVAAALTWTKENPR